MGMCPVGHRHMVDERQSPSQPLLDLAPDMTFRSVVSCRTSGESAKVRPRRSGSVGCPVSSLGSGLDSPICERAVRDGGPTRLLGIAVDDRRSAPSEAGIIRWQADPAPQGALATEDTEAARQHEWS